MFSGKTILERLNDSNYILRSSLSFENNSLKITVKSGFITDGASIPKFFWSLVGCPFSGKYIRSAIIHDALYASHKLQRKDSDSLFRDMLKESKVRSFFRNGMYYALFVGGGSSYKSKSAMIQEDASELVDIVYKKNLIRDII